LKKPNRNPHLLREAGLRQEDLAQALLDVRLYISKYELGERRLDLLELVSICDAVGISLTDFALRFEKLRKEAAH
jgi:transcriptional regulator with XRE-family HTH domain